MLGLTQQTAELISITLQQAQKYDKEVDRISAAWLHQIAQALGADMAYLFRDLGNDGRDFHPVDRQCAPLELKHGFVAMPGRRHEPLCGLARTLANPGVASAKGEDEGQDDGVAPSAGWLNNTPLGVQDLRPRSLREPVTGQGGRLVLETRQVAGTRLELVLPRVSGGTE